MNTRGDTVVDRLRHIPHRVREVTGHGIRRGAAVTLATAQDQSGHDFRQVEPVFAEGEELEEFEELADDMEMAASAISEDVSIEAVISAMSLPMNRFLGVASRASA